MLEVVSDRAVDISKCQRVVLQGYLFCRRAQLKCDDDCVQRDARPADTRHPVVVDRDGNWIGSNLKTQRACLHPIIIRSPARLPTCRMAASAGTADEWGAGSRGFRCYRFGSQLT